VYARARLSAMFLQSREDKIAVFLPIRSIVKHAMLCQWSIQTIMTCTCTGLVPDSEHAVNVCALDPDKLVPTSPAASITFLTLPEGELSIVRYRRIILLAQISVF